MLVTKESNNIYICNSKYRKEKTFFIRNDWRDYKLHALVLRLLSNGSLPLTSPSLQRTKNDFDRVWVCNTILPPLAHGG